MSTVSPCEACAFGRRFLPLEFKFDDLLKRSGVGDLSGGGK